MPTKIDIKANVQSNNKYDVVGEKSLKTLRTYQLGVVYKDKYGRETPVLTSETASFTVPKKLSNNKNSISTSVRNEAPDWADSYKFFVKETSNEYYNACMDRWYDAEDGNIWLSFPSAERNKIQEDTFIVLKKEASSDIAVHEEGRYRVIDVRNEAPDFIKTDYDKYGQSAISVLSGAAIGSNQIQLDATSWINSQFYSGAKASNNAGASINESGFIDYPLRDVVVQMQVDPTGASTPWLDVSGIYGDTTMSGPQDVYLQLSKSIPLDSGIDTIAPSGAATLQIRLAKKVVKPKTEFDGRFFVKIKRDGVINKHIRSVGNTSPSFNVKESIQYYWIARDRPNNNSNTPDKSFWEDIGENWFIDDSDRSRTGDGWGAGNDSNAPWHEDSGYGLIGNNSGPQNFTDSSVAPPAWPSTNGIQDDQRGPAGTGSASDATLRCTMELSINKILDYTESGYNFSNNDSKNQAFHNKMTQHGTLFRFKEDPFQHIYKIIAQTESSLSDSTNGNGILNYSSKSSEKKNPDNKSGRLYLQFKTTGWRLNDTQTSSGVYEHFPSEEDKRPFAFYNSYTPPTFLSTATLPTNELWNPRMKGYADYTGGGVPTDSDGTDLPKNNSSFVANTGVTNEPIHTNTIEIVEIEGSSGGEVIFSDNPAVWETEPREDIGLDIYYEASQAYPLQLSEATNELFAPYGCTVTCDDKRRGTGSEFGIYIPPNTKLVDWTPTGHGGDTILLSCDYDAIGYTMKGLTSGATTTNHIGGNSMYATLNSPTNFYGLELKFTRLDGSYTTAKITYISAWEQINHHQGTPTSLAGMSGRVLIKLDRDLNNMNIKLPYFNCYSFGNGVESDRIRDDFNAVRLDKGVKVSTVLDEPYEEEQRTNGLIYSGIYNSMSGVNNLNQFIAGEKITKDVNPNYGSIQKLKTRDTNLIAFCEDKVLKIVANKDALYNADGQPQLIASNKVLGTTTSFAGEFGISKNPESFASESFRMYFTDKQRGKVLRLSGDGITPISSVGMQDWFADNLKLYNTLTGSFDDRKQEYNLSMTNNNVLPE